MKIDKAQFNLKINTNKLGNECETQPEVYAEVARMYVEAVSRRDEAKQESEVIWSNLFVNYKTGSDKAPSDSTVKALVDIDGDYLKAYKNYLLLKKEADEWLSLKEAFQQRASMIKELCGLYITGYFGGIEVKTDRVKFEEAKYEESKKKLRKGE